MNLQKIYKILKTSEEEIKSSKRNKEIAFNRHIICYFLYNNGIKRNLITKIVNRDRVTVLHSIKVIETFLSINDKETLDKLNKIIKKMRSYKNELETIANDLLTQNAEAKGNENKPNYSNRDFMNAVIIFQTALMDKMYDNQNGMSLDERIQMAERCGLDLRKFIHTYTGLDLHKFEEFL